MDAAFAPIGYQPASPKPADYDRIQPTTPSGSREGGDPAFRPPVDGFDTQRSVNLDPDTGSLVYRMIDVSTGTVRSQTPTDARLQLRAYIDTVVGSEPAPAVEVLA